MKNIDLLNQLVANEKKGKEGGYIGLIDILSYSLYLNLNRKQKNNILNHLIYNIKNYILSIICELISKKNNLNKVELLLYVNEPTHYNQLLKIYNNTNKVYFITNKPKLFFNLRKRGELVYFISVYSMLPSKEYKISKLVQYSKNINNEDFKKIRKLLNKERKKVETLKANMNNLLSAMYSLKYIFVGNDLTYEGRTVTFISKANNKPIGMIQHGLIASDEVNNWHIVDHFFVHGEQYKKNLVSQGLNSNQIIVSGAPYLDIRNLHIENKIHELIQKKFNLNKNEEYILIALSGYGHRTSYNHYLNLLGAIFNAQKNTKIPFIFKLHRKERPNIYHQITKQNSIAAVKIAAWDDPDLPKDIFDWFHGCKAVITGTSTVALEAMLCGIPVISLDLLHEYTGVHFIDQNASINVHSEEELLFQINEILSGRIANQINRDKFIEDNFYKLDGQASNRIIDFIKNYLSNKEVDV